MSASSEDGARPAAAGSSRWWWLVFLAALAAVVAGLLYLLLRPRSIPPSQQLRDAASVAGYLLLLAAAAGVASMATVQVWKVLLRPRAVFHAAELDSVFAPHTDAVLGLASPARGPDSPRPEKAEGLATRRHELLDHPTEVVMGQLRSAAEYIMLRPEGFENALRLLAGDAGKDAVDTYLEERKKVRGSGDYKSDRPGDDALVPVRFFVEQRLNALHATLRERWRRRVRVVALAVAASTGLLAVMFSDLGFTVKLSAIGAAAIWGGFFSWLARDLVAIVERRRA